MPEVRNLRETNFRDFNWVARWRSAQDAVWRQSVCVEAATQRGHVTIADLTDLVQAYEMVPLENVWRAGLKLHFPPDILRMELESFEAARTLLVNGVCSDPVLSLSALVAGGSYATDCLFVVLVEPCDQILLEHPQNTLCTTRIALYADDLNTVVSGPTGAAEAEAASLG